MPLLLKKGLSIHRPQFPVTPSAYWVDPQTSLGWTYQSSTGTWVPLTPSLDLRFAQDKSLRDWVSGKNLVTFTRSSSATYFDSSGVLRTATTNLLLRSEEFDNATVWAPLAAGVTRTANYEAAPNGTTTADRLEFSGADTGINQVVNSINGAVYTASVYIKGIAGQTVRLTGVNFGIAINATLTSGWQRFSISGTATSTAISLSISTFGGATARDISIWGAQLEQSSTVGEYIPTGATINSAPRFDHNPTTGESLGLLVEEQRTNLLLRSEEFGATWQLFRATLNQNAVIAPNGQLTADTLIEDTTSNSHVVLQTVSSLSNATAYTASCYVKASGRDRVRILLFGAAFNSATSYADFNLSSVTASPQAGVTASIVSAGGGWYRCSITATSSASGSTDVYIQTLNSVGQGVYLGNGAAALDIWGAQLEAGAFPTSYIPTTGTAATRNADVASITGANFAKWFLSSNLNTFYVQAIKSQANPLNGCFFSGSNVSLNAVAGGNISFDGNGTRVRIQSRHGAVRGDTASTAALVTPGTLIKACLCTSEDSFGAAFNGTILTSTGSPLQVNWDNALAIGHFPNGGYLSAVNGTISRLTYWPQRLPNATLQAMTL